VILPIFLRISWGKSAAMKVLKGTLSGSSVFIVVISTQRLLVKDGVRREFY
jgi:hypothetical protein